MGNPRMRLDQAFLEEIMDALGRLGVDPARPGAAVAFRKTLEQAISAREECEETQRQLQSLQGLSRKSELDRLELQQKYDALFFRNTDAIFSIDPTGRFISVNPTCMEIAGYSAAEMLAMSFQDLCAPDQSDHTFANFRHCLEGTFEELETAILHKDGTRIELVVYGGPVKRGEQLVALHCAAKDVTQSKRTKAELLKSEERRKLAMEATQDGIWDWDLRTQVIFWSKQLYRIIGRSPDELQPSLDTLRDLLHPDDIPMVFAKMDQHLAGETPIYKTEFRLRHSDGSFRWVLSRARAVRDESGQAIRIVGSHSDITDRKLAQEERDQLSREQEARRQLEEALQSKDRFLAVLSHELRTPLTPVLTSVQLMERDAELPPQHLELVQMIRRNVELEARLIDDLLDLTRISRGKLELFFGPTDIHAKIRQSIEICDSDIRSKHLNLETELGAMPSLIRADAARIQQVLWNLIKNAVKFTPEGGTVGIRTRNAGINILVEVWDTGIGIDQGLLAVIFDAFEQGGRQTTRQHGGLGLGLTVSRWLVEAHGGTIKVQSDGRGKGSSFTVCLPMSDVLEPRNRAQPAPAVISSRQARRLLLVEDNADTSRVMTRLLTLDGYAVQTADSVSAALRAADGESFDLMICDIGLPDGSGLDLIRQILARRPVKAIALSGYGMEEDISRSKAAGFLEHLTKPINLHRLQETINSILEPSDRARDR